jgi:hypothetical protein
MEDHISFQLILKIVLMLTLICIFIKPNRVKINLKTTPQKPNQVKTNPKNESGKNNPPKTNDSGIVLFILSGYETCQSNIVPSGQKSFG